MIASRSRPLLPVAPLLVGLACSAFTRTAAAGDGAAAAEVLFAEGKRLAQDGNFGAACPKFEESQKLDPGVGTLYRLADCYEHVGRTASAWAAFLEVAASAKTSGQQARADDAKKRARDLEPTLAELVIRVAEPDVAGLVVKRGEVVVGQAQWNTPLPVDPGALAVEASAPGRKTWHGSVTLQAHTSAQIEVPALEREAVAAPGALSPSGGPEAPAPDADRSFGTQRTIALVSGAAGVVALGVGGVFGVLSLSKRSNANKHCDAANTCDDDGLKLRHDAIGAGNLSSVFFAAGGVLAATGAVLWLTAPARSLRAGIAPRWAGLDFQMELP